MSRRHQGESDSGARTPTQTYYSRLKRVIDTLNKDAGYTIPWLVSQVSYHPGRANTDVQFGPSGARLTVVGARVCRI